MILALQQNRNYILYRRILPGYDAGITSALRLEFGSDCKSNLIKYNAATHSAGKKNSIAEGNNLLLRYMAFLHSSARNDRLQNAIAI